MPTVGCKFAFRCKSCYQSLIADTDLAGGDIDCSWCGESVVVPEPTDDAIKRAEQLEQEDFKPPKRRNSLKPKPQVELVDLESNQTRGTGRHSRCKNPAARCASRVSRLLARIIDTLFVAFIFIPTTLHTFSKFDVTLLSILQRPELVPFDFWMSAGRGPLLLIALSCFGISFYGQTIGKYIMRIRIVSTDGYSPGFMRGVILRNCITFFSTIVPWIPVLHHFGYWPSNLNIESCLNYELACIYVTILAAGDLALIALEPPRCLHDRVAGTYVVNC